MSSVQISKASITGLLRVLVMATALISISGAASAQVNASLQSYGGTNLTQANATFPDFRVSLSGPPAGTRDAYADRVYGVTNTSNLPYNAYSASSSTMSFTFIKPIVMFQAYAVSLYTGIYRTATYTVTLLDGTKTTTPVPKTTTGGVSLVIRAQAGNPITKVDLSSGWETNEVFNVSALQYELAPAPAPAATVPAATFAQIGAGTAFASASIGSTNNYGGIAAGQLTAWNGTAWVPGGVALSQVAYGSDGTRWGVASSGAIYRYGTSWTTVDGSLRQISVGNASNVWGVNASGSVYKWNGTGWTQIPGLFASVSVGADGTVFGVKADDTLWRWNGSNWVQIGGLLRQISVGSSTNTWGLQSDGAIWKLNATMTGWDIQRQVPPGSYIGVSAAADGSVILVRSDGTLWKK